MQQQELKKQDEKSDSPLPTDDTELSPTPSRDLIEPDPMNPVEPPSDIEQQRERPDLDWAEHED